MAKNDKFFQFPLCALAFGDTFELRLNRIIEWCCMDAGLKMIEKLDHHLLAERAERFADDENTPEDFDPEDQQHIAAMLGANELNIRMGQRLNWHLQSWQELQRFVSEFESKYPGRVWVRFKLDWLFKVRDSQMLSSREFGIVCAIYSVLGDKAFTRITRDRIIRRAMGYKDVDTFNSAWTRRDDQERPLTLAKLQYSLDKLDERGFFARVRANKRETFYSIRMNRDELANALLAYKTRRAEFHAKRRQQNDALQIKIKQRCQSLIKVKKKPSSRTNATRTNDTESSLPSSLGLHFNKNASDKNISDRNSLKTDLAPQAPRVMFPSEDEIMRFYREEMNLGRNVAYTRAFALLKRLVENGSPDGWQEKAQTIECP